MRRYRAGKGIVKLQWKPPFLTLYYIFLSSRSVSSLLAWRPLCRRSAVGIFIPISQINENRFRKHQRLGIHKTLLAPREEKKIGGCFTMKGLICGIHGYWIHNHVKTSITVKYRCKSLKHLLFWDDFAIKFSKPSFFSSKRHFFFKFSIAMM